jgi:hypothetical protein
VPLLAEIEFVLSESVKNLADDSDAFKESLLTGQQLPIFLFDKANPVVGLGATNPAPWDPGDPASFEADGVRATARVLMNDVRAHGPSCRIARTDDRRDQHGEDHDAQKNGDVDLEEVLNDKIRSRRSHGSALILLTETPVLSLERLFTGTPSPRPDIFPLPMTAPTIRNANKKMNLVEFNHVV